MHDPAVGCVPITLNDLPRYTDWPARFLSAESWETKHKTEQEVLREFQRDKWGRLLEQVRSLRAPTLLDVEEAHLDMSTVAPRFDAGAFYLADERHMLTRHLDLYAEVLTPHLEGASCLVELGAGYGSKLLGLARRQAFSRLPLVAGEYTRSGRDLISLVAESLKQPIAVGYCDFRKMTIDGVTIPENAVVFTSYAVHYVPELSLDFVGFLSRLKPRGVVHFEPCYEHYQTDSLHGLMCRRYVELNDYGRNLVTVLEVGRDRDGIVLRARPNVLGGNAFLPLSVLEWAPAGRSAVLT